MRRLSKMDDRLRADVTLSDSEREAMTDTSPVALAASLAPYAPLPWLVHGPDGFELIEHKKGKANQKFIDNFLAKVRNPEDRIGDLRAQLL